MGAIAAVVGILAVAWLVLYLSSYGVLVRSEEVSDEELKQQMTWLIFPSAHQPSETEAHRMLDVAIFAARYGLSSVRRCTYFTGTGVKRALCDPVRETVCPRLWSFGQ